MFSKIRLLIGLGILSGASIAVLIGWLSGFFSLLAGRAHQLWVMTTAWISSSLSIESILVALMPLVMIVVIVLVLHDS